MNIGFDAKRAYHNRTGLGNYSRTLIDSLAGFYPGNRYFLFNPRISALYHPPKANCTEILPQSAIWKLFPSGWRTTGLQKDIRRTKVDLFHGLSNELPINIHKTGVKSVVTIHDLIFERYPHQYHRIDRLIYRKKTRYACEKADSVIAISEQTKKDLVGYYAIREEKIKVCYQSCDPSFSELLDDEKISAIKAAYRLPEGYFLYVGSVIERKNLLNVCRAMSSLSSKSDLPLVVIGQGKAYLRKVREFISENGLNRRVIFLSDFRDPTLRHFSDGKDLPAIYQGAAALIYPSFFEGFGIPVLEALWSRLPVITSGISSLTEVGGGAAIYVDPGNAEEIAGAMLKITGDGALAEAMKNKGRIHAQEFTAEKCAAAVMNVYKSI